MDVLSSFLNLPLILNPKDFVLSDKGVLVYMPENISFFQISSKESFTLYLTLIRTELSKSRKMGVFANSLSDSEKATLKKYKISFISIADEVMIYTKKGEVAFKFNRAKKNDSFSFTTLMSPSGLAVLDTILHLSHGQLSGMSALSLSHQFNLNQPKISKILKVCQVKSLVELKEWIISRDMNWWKEGFLEKKARRFMTPFEIHKRYVPSANKSAIEILNTMMTSSDWGHSISFSGIQLLKEKNEIRDKDIYIAVVPSFERKLFKKYSLLPAPMSLSDFVINVTILRKDLNSESFFSHAENNKHQQFNLLRMMWGIQTEDSRIQEARFDVLKRYLNEYK